MNRLTVWVLGMSLLLGSCNHKKVKPWADLSFPEVPDSIRYDASKIKFIRWEDTPIQYLMSETGNEPTWLAVAGTQQVIRLIPNNGNRKVLGITKIPYITGVNHFFLDMDLTSGYVHPYTVNFFNRLRPDDYVMRFTPGSTDSLTGLMRFIHRRDMSPSDVLGKTIAFFRQWKLSELNLSGTGDSMKVRMKLCDYATFCLCPEVDTASTNPFKKEVPLWNTGNVPGEVLIRRLNKIGKFDGGNVALIWEFRRRIWFQEMHGSLHQVIARALDIQAVCHCDPTLAISDSGPMAASIRSDSTFTLDTDKIRKLENIPYVGAGYGYFPSKVGVYSYTDENGEEQEFVATY